MPREPTKKSKKKTDSILKFYKIEASKPAHSVHVQRSVVMNLRHPHPHQYSHSYKHTQINCNGNSTTTTTQLLCFSRSSRGEPGLWKPCGQEEERRRQRILNKIYYATKGLQPSTLSWSLEFKGCA